MYIPFDNDYIDIVKQWRMTMYNTYFIVERSTLVEGKLRLIEFRDSEQIQGSKYCHSIIEDDIENIVNYVETTVSYEEVRLVDCEEFFSDSYVFKYRLLNIHREIFDYKQQLDEAVETIRQMEDIREKCVNKIKELEKQLSSMVD